jgi:hypothetical protein
MFILEAVIMIVLPFLAHVPEEESTRFWACFCLLFFFGAVNGMCQASVFGLAGILPGEYMGAVMFGNGVSGVACNSLAMIFLATFDPKKEDSAFY